MDNNLIIGSRGSDLALWQANWVKSRLEEFHPELPIEIQVIQTEGDKILDTSLSKIGGKGLFTKTIEDRLLDHTIDLAVHSLKDLPTRLPAGLQVSAVAEREDPRDVLVSRDKRPLADISEGATIATGSLRRKSQLLHARPDLVIQDIRGNVPTRIQKFKDSDWAGLILARAGLKRLDLMEDVAQILDFDVMLPAVSQGALGIETRENDVQVKAIIAPLNDGDTEVATRAERAFLRTLEGGCQIPIGAFGDIVDGQITLQGYVGSLDGKDVVRGRHTGNPDDAHSVGVQLANHMLKDGADEILRTVRENMEIND